MEGIGFVREQSAGHLLGGPPPSSERQPGLRNPAAISWRLRALRSEPRGSRFIRPLYGGQGEPLDTEMPLRHQTQAQSCFSSSGRSPASPSSLHLGGQGGSGVPAGLCSIGRSRRTRRERAAEASTRSGGRERNPNTISVAEPRSESSARHRGPGAG